MTLSNERRKLIRRLGNPRFRGREGLVLVEGVRSATEFLTGAGSPPPRFALVSPRLSNLVGGPEVRMALEALEVPTVEMEDGELGALSDTEHPQGVLLVVEEPRGGWPPPGHRGSFRCLILDGVQDPGNVGTLIRAAHAFNLDAVLAVEGTADPWSPKAVRSAAGASAHLPVVKTTWREASRWLGEREVPLLVAEAGGEDVRTFEVPEGWALVLGNEGAGVRGEIRDGARALLAVPMADTVDSLNVAMAGAILLFALAEPTYRRGGP